ncbi:signal peptide peptidase SppA [Agarivorans sp. B2Z047]|uniref:signal peptide peptidase SppA n=1 Tax=Agarivorans sp. B2Z047 TaxID=2652721 RepID=UPI00128C3CB4|nr:signal peptide peptidase SppA [Agarivorans sp. B2Z047]MPW29698.1 signal peptide peptidase SppA [Agarivorans sp. B2Z047]UQN40651.1 signal peptide peptidase SppA [Agarivorans sp. B2Z047]
MFKLIKNIFRFFWRTLNFIRSLLVNLFLLFMVVMVIIALSSVSQEPVEPPSAAALRIVLDGQIVEQRQRVNPMAELSNELLGNNTEKEIDLHNVVKAIDEARIDSNITGLVLELGAMPNTSQTKLAIIGKALKRFKDSDKPIIAYADYYDQHQYYLASFADQLLLNPKGAVLMRGMNSRRLFFKDAIDKLDITTHVFRVGTHKSFVEPYLRNDMSDEAKQDLARWMDQLWSAYLNTVANNRQLSVNHLLPEPSALLARLKTVDGNGARYAEKFGLVDQLTTRAQAKQILVDTFGENDEGDSYQARHYAEYLQNVADEPSSENKIALIVAQGAIVGGRGQEKVIAADTVLAQLNQVLDDEQIKAVVMRVDSPGGSAFASELIREKLQQIQEQGIPVVVSMGSVAASGGYWISSTADQIFASPTTITGSIGIFGMFATLENALAKLGISSDGYATSPLAEISPFQPLPKELAEIIQLNVEHGYHDFLSLVSAGRDIPLSNMEKIAEGRIWTGQDALNNGLVDQLGDLNDAIDYAASINELDSYQVETLTPPLNPRERLIAQFFDSQISAALANAVPNWQLFNQVAEQAPAIDKFSDPLGQYSFCAVCEQF